MIRKLLLAATLTLTSVAVDAQAGHVTGIGGVFVASKDPKALASWYREVLGLKIESWGGALLRYTRPATPT